MNYFTWAIIGFTVLISFLTFRNRGLYEGLLFSVEGVLGRKEWYRILTSQLLHVDITHLFFNMFSFYSFARSIEGDQGGGILALIYFGSAVGGDLLALLLQRRNFLYRAVGASGAVSGVIFAYILDRKSVV